MERHATEKEREDIKVALTSASDFLEGAEVESSGSKAIRLKLTEVILFFFFFLFLVMFSFKHVFFLQLKEMWRPLERRIKLFKELPGSITKVKNNMRFCVFFQLVFFFSVVMV